MISKFVAICLAALVVSLAAPVATATPLHTGLCLFGHKNPRNPRSGCRFAGEDWPYVESDFRGTPEVRCTGENDGQTVRTLDYRGRTHVWICGRYKDYKGYEYWQFKELVEG